MVILQGDVFWAELRPPVGSEPGYLHPVVVVQNDAFNQSPIGTVLVCALTSTIDRAWSPGNVLLAKGEANLDRRSVVNVAQILTLNRNDLHRKIGALSKTRVTEIVSGIHTVIQPM
jgi:mRNA interferase MazF